MGKNIRESININWVDIGWGMLGRGMRKYEIWLIFAFASQLLFVSPTYEILVFLPRTNILNPGKLFMVQWVSYGSWLDILRVCWIYAQNNDCLCWQTYTWNYTRQFEVSISVFLNFRTFIFTDMNFLCILIDILNMRKHKFEEKSIAFKKICTMWFFLKLSQLLILTLISQQVSQCLCTTLMLPQVVLIEEGKGNWGFHNAFSAVSFKDSTEHQLH